MCWCLVCWPHTGNCSAMRVKRSEGAGVGHRGTSRAQEPVEEGEVGSSGSQSVQSPAHSVTASALPAPHLILHRLSSSTFCKTQCEWPLKILPWLPAAYRKLAAGGCLSFLCRLHGPTPLAQLTTKAQGIRVQAWTAFPRMLDCLPPPTAVPWRNSLFWPFGQVVC